MRSLLLLALFFVVLYVVMCALVAWSQDSLLFYPWRQSVPAFKEAAANLQMVPWQNSAGQIIGVHSRILPGSSNRALLVMHGNGGDALSRSYMREIIGEGWDLYLLEYPGYGPREGTPSESSITSAATEAVDLIQNNELYFFGESLGSGVACLTAAARPQREKGMFLISPYPSLVPVAASHYPWLPVSLLLRTRFDAENALKTFTGPIAFGVGGGDTVIPNRFGRQLYDTRPNRKHWWEAPAAGHDTAEIINQHWPAMERWMNEQRGN